MRDFHDGGTSSFASAMIMREAASTSGATFSTVAVTSVMVSMATRSFLPGVTPAARLSGWRSAPTDCRD